MSALKTLTQLCVSKTFLFLLAVIFAGLLLVLPQLVSANALPSGVLERQTCGAFSVDIHGYGAGMMHNLTPIEISNRRLSYISPTEDCAVVQWQSSTPAATQVLFAELTTEPVTIDTTIDPDFGYPHATTQNNAGIATHTAILTGLDKGKAYSYRLVTRSHPTAIPNISDAHVLIAGPSIATPPVVVTPITPIPPATVPTTPKFDAEKFPIVPNTLESPTTEAPESVDTSTTTMNVVPAALTAVESALPNLKGERMFWKKVKGFFVNLKPQKDRLNLSSNIGLFEKDRYIVPTLFFLGILFLLQRFIFPAFDISLKNPLLYWMFGSVVLTVLSAAFMMYYITLIGIALFLGLLAWYLLQSVPDEADAPKTLTVVNSDLKTIEGVGPKIESLLNKAGIHTFDDLIKSNEKELRTILEKGGDRFAMHDPKSWPAQAKLAAEKKWEKLQKLQDKLQGGKE